MSRDEGFMARWNRRKAAARGAPDAAPAEAMPETPAVADAAPPARPADSGPPDMLRDEPPDEETRAAWIAELEGVDLEALNYKDDFTVFLRSWVPQALRNKALKRLWRTSDVFEVLDGLAEYDEDYSVAAAGVVKSSWQAGRGFAADKVEAVEDIEEDAEAANDAPAEAGAEERQDEGLAADESANDSPADDGGSGEETKRIGETASGD